MPEAVISTQVLVIRVNVRAVVLTGPFVQGSDTPTLRRQAIVETIANEIAVIALETSVIVVCIRADTGLQQGIVINTGLVNFYRRLQFIAPVNGVVFIVIQASSLQTVMMIRSQLGVVQAVKCVGLAVPVRRTPQPLMAGLDIARVQPETHVLHVDTRVWTRVV